ncbi:tRNA (5-methylaminomethyl-2-thiouridine)(34)-methyltransferase MnmD [Psychroserpens sp. XS_ASV72]|uniref:tRNA (5-methylaminomethyl-2-thiouridine)(34)-methyltransferase MnmD n=1 Tax=Psychroserpens sp. XS_ASV72 TaxID=3241293 RepID=UPI003516964C
MKRKIITTADGSKTIQIEEWNEQYHSVHGSINEAIHVYIKHGLLFYYTEFHNAQNPISVLEVGFGTGLNAILSLKESEALNIMVDYTGVEAYPVSHSELEQLNYIEALNLDAAIFNVLHEVPWETKQQITNNFLLTKQQKTFDKISESERYDVIYYDAFGARVQPELWTEEMFEKMFKTLKPDGVLVTYSAKGSVKRALTSVGFEIERLKGPPGKRHMLRAIKR